MSEAFGIFALIAGIFILALAGVAYMQWKRDR